MGERWAVAIDMLAPRTWTSGKTKGAKGGGAVGVQGQIQHSLHTLVNGLETAST